MAEIILESLLATLAGINLSLLLLKYKDLYLHNHNGWKFIICGFALIFFGMLIDITDNFPTLNKYIFIGDTIYGSILKKVVGYLFGFALLGIGFWKFMKGISGFETKESKPKMSAVHKIESMEQNMKNSLVFQQELLNAIPVPVFYKNNEGIYLGCNKEFETFFGSKREDIIGKSVYDIAPDDLANGYYEKDLELFNHPGTQIYEFQVKNKSDRIRKVIFHKATFHDDHGKVSGLIGAILDITERKEAEEEREKLITKLQFALDKVKVLSGFLPICSSCKKIRDDKGYWNQIEEYISKHSEAEFSHGICPTCEEKLYPDLQD